MIEFELDKNNSILYVKPKSALQVEDFAQLSAALDPYLNMQAHLKGLVVETLKFPGWKNFNAFIAHMKFIKNHVNKINKIALVTNSPVANVAEKLGGFFPSTQIKHFPFDKVTLAKQWIEQ